MAKDGEFRIATFNINHVCKGAGDPNAEAVARSIRECGCEIVGLQESNRRWEGFLDTPALRAVYPHVRFHECPGNPWGGFGVLSQHPIRDFKVLPETDRGWYPAGLVTLEVAASKARSALKEEEPTSDDNDSSSRLLQVLIVHLRAPVEWSHTPFWWGGHADWIGGWFSKRVKAARLHEITTFSNALDPRLPSIVVGDFNERSRNSPCLAHLEGVRNLTNLPKRAVSGWWWWWSCHAQNSWRIEVLGVALLSLDYDHVVFSSEHLEPSERAALVHGASGSDHRMVSAGFRFLPTKG